MFTTNSPIIVSQMALVLAVFGILVAISVIDIRTRRIPNLLNLAILACGCASIWIFPDTLLTDRVIGMFCISLSMFLFAVAIKDSFGMGDVKLMAAAGFLLGWKRAIFAFCAGTMLGGIYAIVLLVAGKVGRRGHFAFGPCLAVGIIFALLR